GREPRDPRGVDGRPHLLAGRGCGQRQRQQRRRRGSDHGVPGARRGRAAGRPHLHDDARLRRHARRAAGHPGGVVPAVGLPLRQAAPLLAQEPRRRPR
ncbi:Protein of unknown function, partial [Gryllus bimaculatus]